MKRSAPPPAKLANDSRGKECWVCYYCERLFLPADFGMLGDREVLTCQNCGRIQVVGKDERIRQAAREADAEQPLCGPRDYASEPTARVTVKDHDRRAMNRLAAAMERQQDRDFFGPLRRKRQQAAESLPPSLSRKTLNNIQQSYDSLKEQRGRAPSQASVEKKCGHARTTVREYWHFVKK